MSGLEHIDPVCGMKVDAESTACSIIHQNQSYYFCGLACRRKFEADPAKYFQPRVVDWACELRRLEKDQAEQSDLAANGGGRGRRCNQPLTV